MKKISGLAIILVAASHIMASGIDYNSLHTLLIRFYGYQRAGLKSGSCHNLNSNFTSGTHNGDNYNNNPLDAGWYDAGDYIKFGLPLSYAVYCLLKGYDVFPNGYDDKDSWEHNGKGDGIPDILNEVKSATDYLIKAVIDENTVVRDVGSGQSEHDQDGFNGPPDKPSGRSGSSIYLCDGADIPATYAACLALMSTLYRKHDAGYADQCLAKAKLAFKFAKKKYDSNALYCQAQKDNANNYFYYYPFIQGAHSYASNDRKVAAGVELYRATNGEDPIYKTWAQLAITGIYDCMGFSYIGPLASFEAWRQGLVNAPSALMSGISFARSKIQTTGKFKNVYQNSSWGTARDVGTVALQFALGYVITPGESERKTLLDQINEHVNWLLGKSSSNSQSFVCGTSGGPSNAHYRTTSNKAVPGGVVAGPNPSGNWQDIGSMYQFTEVALDYNAGITGAIGFLRAINNPPSDAVGILESFNADPKTDIDFTKKDVKITCKFSKSVKWTVKITGENGSKTFTGTGTSISQVWDGSADKGVFLGGEMASLVLTIDGKISVIDLVKANGFQMGILKNKKAAPKSSDKLIDNFDDSNRDNMVNGKWEEFGTKTGPLFGTSASLASDEGSVALVIKGSVSTNDNKNWAGIKTTFNNSGSPINVGNIKSVLFDLRTKKECNVRVELEQSTITDNAYYGITIPVKTVSNRYRVNISDFKQPDWKTNAKELDLKKISSLRFTVYDSVGQTTLYLDNVYIEDFVPSSVSSLTSQMHGSFKQIVSFGNLVYSIPQISDGTLNITIYNIAGKNVLTRTYSDCSGKDISLPLGTLPPGMYTAINSINGVPMGGHFKFVHTR